MSEYIPKLEDTVAVDNSTNVPTFDDTIPVDNYLPNTEALKKGFSGDPLAVFTGAERSRLENLFATYDNPEEEKKKHVISQYLAPRAKMPPEAVLSNFQYSVDAFFGKKGTSVDDAYAQIGELLNPKPVEPPAEQLRKLVDLKSYQTDKIPDASALDGLVNSATNSDGLIRNAGAATAKGAVTLAGGLMAAPDLYAEVLTDLSNYPYNAFQTYIMQKPERQLWYRESMLASKNNPLKAYRDLGEYMNNDVAKMIDVKQIEGDLYDLIADGEYSQAAEKIVYSVFENMPQYALLFMTNKGALMAKIGKDLDVAKRAQLIGDLGLMAIGASSAGTKYMALKDTPGDPGLKQYNALMTSEFEMVTERLFALPVIEKYFANDGIKQNVLKAAKEYVKDMFTGGTGEALSQVGENVTDRVSGLGNQSLTSGVLEAFIVGGLMEGSPGALNMLRVLRSVNNLPQTSYSDLEQLNTAIREAARKRKEELLAQENLTDEQVQELRRATQDEQNPNPANTIIDAMLAEDKANTDTAPVDDEIQAAVEAAARAQREVFDERNRRENSAPVHLDQIQTAVDEVAAAFPGVKVVVVNQFSDLPEKTRNQIAADPAKSLQAGKARGVYNSYDDTVYMIASKLSVQNVPVVMFHEALGHKGFYDYLGRELMPLVDKIFTDITASIEQHNTAAGYNFDLTLPGGQRQATLEYVASISENIIKRGATRPSWWKGVLFQVKQRLRTLPGFKKMRFTDREIEGILAKSFQKMRENAAAENNVGVNMSVNSDAEYLDAVNRGDMETAQRMVDEKAREKGYNIKAFHGTVDKFTEFAEGRTPGILGWFSTSDEHAAVYSEKWDDETGEHIEGKVLTVNIAPSNPIDFTKATTPLPGEDYAQPITVDELLQSAGQPILTIKEREKLDKDGFGQDDPREPWEIVYLDVHGVLVDILKKRGFNGIKQVEGHNGKNVITYGVFNNAKPSKLADAVLRDSNKKIIPLSQRFNDNTNNINFSLAELPTEPTLPQKTTKALDMYSDGPAVREKFGDWLDPLGSINFSLMDGDKVFPLPVEKLNITHGGKSLRNVMRMEGEILRKIFPTDYPERADGQYTVVDNLACIRRAKLNGNLEKFIRGELVPDNTPILSVSKLKGLVEPRIVYAKALRTLSENVITRNVKTGLSVDFPLSSCIPTEGCGDTCYAAGVLQTSPDMRINLLRNLLHCLADENKFATYIAEQINTLRTKKNLLSRRMLSGTHIRFCAFGDLGFKEQTNFINLLMEKVAPDTIGIVFSRNHTARWQGQGALDQLTPRNNLIINASIDRQLIREYGIKDLLIRNGKGWNISYLFVGPDDGPLLKELLDEAIMPIIHIDIKDYEKGETHDALVKAYLDAGYTEETITYAICPCSVRLQMQGSSCAQCQLGCHGCFARFKMALNDATILGAAVNRISIGIANTKKTLTQKAIESGRDIELYDGALGKAMVVLPQTEENRRLAKVYIDSLIELRKTIITDAKVEMATPILAMTKPIHQVENPDNQDQINFSLANYETDQTEPAVKIEYKREKWLTFASTTVRGPADMAFAFHGLRDSSIERAFITGLKDGKPVCVQPIGFGSNNMTSVFLPNAIDMLKKFNCTSAYIVHNHPSGVIEPSSADLNVGEKAKKILNILGIKYDGHIIIDTTKFTHLNEYNTPAEYEHTTLDGKGVKVPLLEQYAVWKNKTKTSDYPSIRGPEHIFEIFKGWELDMFGTLVIFANTKNNVIHAELMPVETINSKTLMEKAAATNCISIFIASQSISDEDKIRLGSLNKDLQLAGFILNDVIISPDKSNYQSMRQENKITINDEVANYNFSLASAPNSDIERLGTILVPGIMRNELKTWEDAQTYFESQGITGLEKHEIQLAFGEARYQMERKKSAKKKKDYQAWFKANHPILWDIEARIGTKIKPDAKFGRRKDITGYYVDWKNGMPSDEAAKILDIKEEDLIDAINNVKATELKQQFTTWKAEKNDEDAYWEKLAWEERQRETATIIDDVITGKVVLNSNLRKTNPEAAQGIYELISGQDKMPPDSFDWSAAQEKLVRRSQGIEDWNQIPTPVAAAPGVIDPNAPAGTINPADAERLYNDGFAAGEQQGKTNAENDYLKLIEALRANQKDIVAMQKLLKEFAYQTLPAGERDIALNAIIQLANASNEPTKKYPNGERRALLEKIMNKFQKIRDVTRKEQLLQRITERIEQTAAKRGQHGKPVGKYSQEEQISLDRIREIIKMTPGVVNIEKEFYQNQAETLETNGENNSMPLEHLAMLEEFGNLEFKSVPDLEKALKEIQRLAATGRMKLQEIIRKRRAQVEEDQARFINEVTGGDGLVSPQDERKLVNARAESPVSENIKQFWRQNLNFTFILNNITRFAGKKLSDTLAGRWAHNEHLAEQREFTGRRLRGEAFNEVFDKIFGTSGSVSRGKKLVELRKLATASGVFRNQRLPGKGIEYSRLTVEGAQTMLNDHAAGLNKLQDFEVECIKHQLDDIAAGAKAQLKTGNDETIDDVMQLINDENGKKTVVLPRITDPGALVEQPLSQAGALQLWLCWQQSQVKYKMQFNGWNNTSVAQLEKFLTPEMKKIGEFMRDELERDYPNVNKMFGEMYYIAMPHTRNYFPTSYDVNSGVGSNTKDAFGMPFGMATVSPGALKSRRFHLMEPAAVDAFSNYSAHVVQMEHFKAIAPGVRDMRSVINNRDCRKSIEQKRGEIAYKDLVKAITAIADGGRRDAENIRFISQMYSPWVVSKLMINTQSALKQLAGALAYVNAIPAHKFISGSVDFWTAPVENARMLMNTDYFKNRYSGAMDRDLNMLLDWSSSVAGRNSGWMHTLVQEGAILNKAGDALSVIVAGYSVYKYHYDNMIKRGVPEADAHAAAIIEWEKASDATQQSGAIKDMNMFQMGGAISRMFTTYLSNPILVMQAQVEEVFDVAAGRGDMAKLSRMIMINHLIVPSLMVGIAQALRNGTDWDEYDLSDYILAMIMGPFEGLFLLGKGGTAAINAIMGKWNKAASAFPVVDDVSKLAKQMHKITTGDAEISAEEIINALANTGAALTPFSNTAAVAGAAARETRRWFRFFSDDKPKHGKKDTGIL